MANIYVDGNINTVYVHRDLTRLCILAKGLSTQICVHEKFSLTARWRLQCTLLYILREEAPGFLTLCRR
jgi:hypothetical protein